MNELPDNEAKKYYIDERNIAFEGDNIRGNREKKKNPRWQTLMNRVKKEIKESTNKKSKDSSKKVGVVSPQPVAPVAPVELEQPPNNTQFPIVNIPNESIYNRTNASMTTPLERNRSNSVESVPEIVRASANAEADKESLEESTKKVIEKLIQTSEESTGVKFTEDERNNFNKLPNNEIKTYYISERNEAFFGDNIRSNKEKKKNPRWQTLMNRVKGEFNNSGKFKTTKGGSRKVSPVGPGINMRVKRAPKKKTRKVKANAKRKTRKL